MVREIVIWPEAVLDTETREVVDFGPELKALLADLAATVAEAEGVGIAANQVGVPLRVALVGKGDGTFVEMVNPRITALRGPTARSEGCLSIPGEAADVPRFTEVDVTYQDRRGTVHRETATERFAHVIQHEVDHLDGLVYARRLSALKRALIRRRMEKLRRQRP